MDLRLNVAHLPEGKVIAHRGGKASKGEGPYGPRGALEKEDTRPMHIDRYVNYSGVTLGSFQPPAWT